MKPKYILLIMLLSTPAIADQQSALEALKVLAAKANTSPQCTNLVNELLKDPYKMYLYTIETEKSFKQQGRQFNTGPGFDAVENQVRLRLYTPQLRLWNC